MKQQLHVCTVLCFVHMGFFLHALFSTVLCADEL